MASIALISLSFSGIAAAWYQTHYAAKAFSCNLGFADKLMINTGLDAGLPSVFGIFASCADAVVNILGLDYSTWSLLLFGALGSLSTIVAVRSLRRD
jgi:disulfide bond formation protein DsbB